MDNIPHVQHQYEIVMDAVGQVILEEQEVKEVRKGGSSITRIRQSE